MTVFVVFSMSMDRPVFNTLKLVEAKAYVESRLAEQWAFKDGRYYCPYVIYDCYVYDGAYEATASEDDLDLPG